MGQINEMLAWINNALWGLVIGGYLIYIGYLALKSKFATDEQSEAKGKKSLVDAGKQLGIIIGVVLIVEVLATFATNMATTGIGNIGVLTEIASLVWSSATIIAKINLASISVGLITAADEQEEAQAKRKLIKAVKEWALIILIIFVITLGLDLLQGIVMV